MTSTASSSRPWPDLPRKRFLSVEALLRELTHFERHEPFETIPQDRRERVRKFLRRRRRPLLVAAVFSIVIILLSAGYVVGLKRALERTVAEAKRATQVEQLMADLLGGGDLAVGPSAGLTVEALLNRAVERQTQLADDPALQGDVLARVGASYVKLGALDKAAPLLARALRLHQLHDNEGAALARDHLLLGELAHERGDPESALREGLEAYTRALDNVEYDLPFRAAAVTLVGMGFDGMGQYDASANWLRQEMAALLRAGAKDGDLSEVRGELANAELARGRLEVAEQLHRQALDHDQKTLGRRHPHVADSLLNLAVIALKRGFYTEALEGVREAYAILDEYHGPANAETASALVASARALIPLQRYDEAEQALMRAQAVYTRIYAPDHSRRLALLNELATLALLRGQLAVAERYAADNLAGEEGRHPRDVARIGVASANIAGVYIEASQNLTTAEWLLRGAVRTLDARSDSLQQDAAIARLKLGRALRMQGENVAALAEIDGAIAVLARNGQAAVWLYSAANDLESIYMRLGMAREAAALRRASAGW